MKMKLKYFSLFFMLYISPFTAAEEASSFRRFQKLHEFQEKLQQRFASAPPTHQPVTSPSASTPKLVGKVVYPIGYGADPSGARESSDAILEAINDAFEMMRSGLQMLPRVNDLGGVVIDLQGGSFSISKPITFPASGGGNLVVQGGTFRASDTFPGDRHLVELVSPNSVAVTQTSPPWFSVSGEQNSRIIYEDITFRDILFDSGFRGGGVWLADTARVRITNCFFLHFTTQGIFVQRGHETFISNTFLGQHSSVGGDSGERGYSGTAIDLSSNDNAITDVVIFSAAVGISLSGAANVVTGVHCYNKATGFGGVGILVKAHLTRIDSCYLDYTGIVIEDPVQVHVTNGLFLGDANIKLRSINGRILGLTIVNNMFNGNPSQNLPIITLDGEFGVVDQVVIDRNNANGMSLRSTVGKLTVAGNGTRWVADLSPILVFPNRVNHFQYSFWAQGGLMAVHAVTNISNNAVVVETDRAVTGVVSVVVEQ